MTLTISQNIIQLNLTVSQEGTSIVLNPVIYAGTNITNTSQLVNDGDNGSNPFITQENDPLFQTWLATNPLNGFITQENDPLFQAWLLTNPLNGKLDKNISTYTPATTPLSGTEKALIHDGVDFKEVAVSDINRIVNAKVFDTAEKVGLKIQNLLDEDFRRALVIQGGLTANQRRYFEYLNHLGARTNLLGFNAQNSFIAFDSINNYHFLSCNSAGTSSINSFGTFQVRVNADEGATGNNGMAIYDGTANPTASNIMYNLSSAGIYLNKGRFLQAQSPDNLQFNKFFCTNGSAYINSTVGLRFYNTANQFSFADSGLVDRMRIDTSGSDIKVGIGTTNPIYNLNVQSNFFTQALIKGTESIRTAELLILNNLDRGLNINVTGSSYGSGTQNDIRLSPQGTGMQAVSIGAARGSGIPTFTANVSTTNVGIGTASPQARLDVRAQGALATDIVFRVRNSTDMLNLLTLNGQGRLILATTGFVDNGQTLQVNGTIYANGSISMVAGSKLNIGTSWTGVESNIFQTRHQGDIGFRNLPNNNFSLVIKENRNILIGTETDIPSSKLTVESTTQGFLPPRMTTAQRNAIAIPAAGLVVYDTTDNKHYGYNGTTWNSFY